MKGLYLVATQGNKDENLFLHYIQEALEGGVDAVQLREKNLSTLSFYELALKVQAITRSYGKPLIINDHIDIALAIDADGVHLGQEDFPLWKAREILGEGKILGLSVQNREQLGEIKEADYLGIGAIFPTQSKSDAKVIGLAGLREIVLHSSKPLVAIGGINESNIEQLQGLVEGIAVISAIMDSPFPKRSAENLKAKFLKESKSYFND